MITVSLVTISLIQSYYIIIDNILYAMSISMHINIYILMT